MTVAPLIARLRPAAHSRAAVNALLDHVTWEMETMPAEYVRALMPILGEAEREVAKDLRRWLATATEPEARFTAQQYRSILLQLRRAQDLRGPLLEQPEWVLKLRQTTLHSLKVGGLRSGELATEHLMRQMALYAQLFSDARDLLPFRTAAIIADGQKTLVPRFRTSAARYAGNCYRDIKAQLGIGVVRGETVWQLTNRLQRLGGPKGWVATKGVLGEPGAVSERIAEGLFKRYRHWGERLVRTELLNAYNLQADDAIQEVAKENPEESLLKRWDARRDRRICGWCAELDGTTTKPNGTFSGGIAYPPAHANCRCAVVMWAERWGKL